MGPRSEDRGNVPGRLLSPASARASMGPRSEDRGNVDLLADLGLFFRAASMGPRSEDRGNTGQRWLEAEPAIGFNGAAI